MKTAVLLSAASLAAAFVIPGNDQQLLGAFTKDVTTTTGGIASAAEEVVPSKEKLGHHHDDESEKSGFSAGNDVKQKWNQVAGFAEGLEESVMQFEEVDLEWLGRSDERPFGREVKMEKHGKGKKHGKEEHHKEKHHKEKHHKEKHHKEKHHKGEHHKGEHHKGEHAPEHEVDEFDIPPCPHHAGTRGHGFFSKVFGRLKHMLGLPAPMFEGPHGPPHHGHPPGPPPPGAHHGHHEPPTSTIYEQISKSKHTRIFTRIINQYDEVVKYLNSTSANYTVFVPIDAAFEGIDHPHHNISKKAILHWLEYHISPEVYTLHDFFDVQTVPTLTHEETKSKFPQRLSTSFTHKGLTLNFHSHVIRHDIPATNGVIHAIDKLIIPALSAKTVIELVPSLFSTLDLALVKTGLIDVLNPESSKIGGTLFAPTNKAFAKLPTKVNAFLFSAAGQKYLKALLKYHIVPGHTVFTDAYYKAKPDEEDSLLAKKHLDLPTYLDKKPIAIDIRNFHRLTLMTVNKHTPVSVVNVPVKEGVVHLVSSILIPPHKHHHDEGYEHEHEHEHEHHDLTVQELMDRLEAYVE